jgi:hypothetical protein
VAARIDAELDLHGYTAASAREQLETVWSRRAWHGMRRIRIIHGTGEVLHKVVRSWADERSIPWTLETYNPGVTILQPSLRREPAGFAHNFPFARYRDKLKAVLPAEEPKPSAPPPAPEKSVAPVAQRSNGHSPDLFAQEIERLGEQDPRSLHKRKHGM